MLYNLITEIDFVLIYLFPLSYDHLFVLCSSFHLFFEYSKFRLQEMEENSQK